MVAATSVHRKIQLGALGDDDVADRPGDDAQHHAEADPAQQIHGGVEFRRVEKRHQQRRDREGRDQTGSGKQNTDLGLLVDQTVARLIVVVDRRQPRIEIGTHRLQDKPGIKAADRPRCLVEAGRLDAVEPHDDDADGIGRADGEDRAGHEGEAELEQRGRFRAHLP